MSLLGTQFQSGIVARLLGLILTGVIGIGAYATLIPSIGRRVSQALESNLVDSMLIFGLVYFNAIWILSIILIKRESRETIDGWLSRNSKWRRPYLLIIGGLFLSISLLTVLLLYLGKDPIFCLNLYAYSSVSLIFIILVWLVLREKIPFKLIFKRSIILIPIIVLSVGFLMFEQRKSEFKGFVGLYDEIDEEKLPDSTFSYYKGMMHSIVTNHEKIKGHFKKLSEDTRFQLESAKYHNLILQNELEKEDNTIILVDKMNDAEKKEGDSSIHTIKREWDDYVFYQVYSSDSIHYFSKTNVIAAKDFLENDPVKRDSIFQSMIKLEHYPFLLQDREKLFGNMYKRSSEVSLKDLEVLAEQFEHSMDSTRREINSLSEQVILSDKPTNMIPYIQNYYNAATNIFARVEFEFDYKIKFKLMPMVTWITMYGLLNLMVYITLFSLFSMFCNSVIDIENGSITPKEPEVINVEVDGNSVSLSTQPKMDKKLAAFYSLKAQVSTLIALCLFLIIPLLQKNDQKQIGTDSLYDVVTFQNWYAPAVVSKLLKDRSPIQEETIQEEPKQQSYYYGKQKGFYP